MEEEEEEEEEKEYVTKRSNKPPLISYVLAAVTICQEGRVVSIRAGQDLLQNDQINSH